MDDLTIIGIGSLFFGFIFFALGILLLFDRALLTMSNFFFLCSAIIFMKPKGFFEFFINQEKIHGSIAFFLGILLVLLKFVFPGILCEIVGAYWLFNGFIPLLMKTLLEIPFLRNFFQKQDEGTFP